jgi:CheY-like chemotaxis protein
MPEEDGYSFIRKIRERPAEKGGGTPAIAFTAFAREDDMRQALDSGFQVHLAKPIDPAVLVMNVVHLLEQTEETKGR